MVIQDRGLPRIDREYTQYYPHDNYNSMVITEQINKVKTEIKQLEHLLNKGGRYNREFCELKSILLELERKYFQNQIHCEPTRRNNYREGQIVFVIQ